MSKLCVTVTGRTMAELRKRRDEVAGADLVELRVDTVTDPDAAAALAGRKVPVIFTCRASWEGGHFRGSEEERRRLLMAARQLGADYIDVEWRAGFDDIVADGAGRGIVLSVHEFARVPSDLSSLAEALRATGAEIIKIAVMATQLADTLSVMSLGRRLTGSQVLLAMGEAGLASRVLAEQSGSSWTYAGEAVAPGQLPTRQLCDELAFRRVTRTTAVYGVVGRPVLHSLSPAMHNAAFAAAGLDAVYLPLAASDFDDFAVFAEGLPIAGASVTAPFKLSAFAFAAKSEDVSRRARAANTLRRTGDGWEACNTDVAGFLAPLQSAMNVAGRRCTVLGAGGAARAVVEGLESAGAKVSVAARRRDQATEVARLTSASVAEWPPPPGSWDLLVNATPVGTAPAVEDSPLPDGPFAGELVYDLVYNPLDTRLLRDAREAGCRTIGGLEMLVAQAEEQFAWWTGRRPSAGVMRQAALRALESRTAGTIGTLGAIGTVDETDLL